MYVCNPLAPGPCWGSCASRSPWYPVPSTSDPSAAYGVSSTALLTVGHSLEHIPRQHQNKKQYSVISGEQQVH